MMITATIPTALALLLTTTTTLALPTSDLLPRTTPLTAASLLAIAPTSNTCDGATHPLECRTAQQALDPILASFNTYKITDPATQAAVISTIAFESGEFKFAHHYFPTPVAGQGTRNMQSAEYNLKYAQSIPALAPQLKVAEAAGAENVTSLLISYANYDFGSAAWFLTTQCEPEVVSGLANAGESAFKAYLGCIRTDASKERMGYYTSALKAFGITAGN